MSPQSTQIEFALHHQNDALLFQFILHESIATHKIIHADHDLKEMNGNLIHTVGKGSFWQAEMGHLQKLRNYYSLFVTHFSELNPLFSSPLKKFGKAVESAIAIVKEIKDPAALFIKQLKRECNKMALSLSEMIAQFRTSENVLFFLLNHREACDFYFGKDYVAKVLNELFSGGIEETKQFLFDSYSRRGFQYLLPIIQKNFECLKN